MAYSNFYQKSAEFPSHTIDPKHKDEKWCKKMMEAILCEFDTGAVSKRDDWVKVRKYSDGNQPNDKYINILTDIKDAHGKKLSFMNLDQDIVSPLPQLRDIVVGHFNKIQYDVVATAINPEAVDKKEEYKSTLKAKGRLAGFTAELENLAGRKLGGDIVLPESEEELEIISQTSYKTQEELVAELTSKAVMNENRYEEIQKLYSDDMFDCAFIAGKTVTDWVSKTIRVEYWDPVNVIYRNFKGKHYNEDYIGVVTEKSLEQIQKESNNKWNEDEMMHIKNAYNGAKNGDTPFSYRQTEYINTDDNYQVHKTEKVLVMEMYWFTNDYKKKKKITKSDGTSLLFNMPYKTNLYNRNKSDGSKVTTYEIGIKKVFQGYWILGTEYLYNCGAAYDIVRDQDNPRDCTLPGFIYRAANKSLAERAMPIVDGLQINWLKFQNAKALAKPKGMILNLSAIEGVKYDNKDMATKEIITLYNHTGVLLARLGADGIDPMIPNPGGSPLIELEGGLGNQLQEWITDWNFLMQQLREYTGVNEVIGSSANLEERKALGVAEIQMESAETGLSKYVEGIYYARKWTTRSILSKIQTKGRASSLSWLEKKIGKAYAEILHNSKEFGNMVFDLMFIPAPGEREKKMILDVVAQTMAKTNNSQPGGIEVDDYLYLIKLIEEGNIRLANIVLKIRIEKKKQKDQEAQKEMIQAQGEQIQKQQQVSEEEKRKTLLDDTDQKIRFDVAATDQNIREEQAKGNIKSGQILQESILSN